MCNSLKPTMLHVPSELPFFRLVLQPASFSRRCCPTRWGCCCVKEDDYWIRCEFTINTAQPIHFLKVIPVCTTWSRDPVINFINLGPYSVIFLFFIPARVYLCSCTHFAIKDLAIICMNKFLKSNMQVSSSLQQATIVPRNASDVLSHLCHQLDVL